MPSFMSILAVETDPTAIIPCVKVNKGLWLAATVHRTPFYAEMRFTYTSEDGRTVGPIASSQLVNAFTFHRDIDSKYVDVHGLRVAIPTKVKSGSMVTCGVKMTITDATGATVDLNDPEPSSVVAP